MRRLGLKTENGKTEWLENDRPNDPVLIVGKEARPTIVRGFLDETRTNNSCAFFGDVEDVLPYIPESRWKDVILIERDIDRPFAINPFYKVKEHERADVAAYIVDAFKAKGEYDIATTQFDNNLQLAAFTMLHLKATAFFSLELLFTSKRYRAVNVGKVKDPYIARKWKQFDGWKPERQQDFAQSVLNRLSQLNTDPDIRAMLAQKKSFPLKDNSIVIVHLPDNDRYDVVAALIMACLSGLIFIDRPKIAIGKGIPVVGCEYLGQLASSKLERRLLGSSTIMGFRVGSSDAKTLRDHFNFVPDDTKFSELKDGLANVQLGRSDRVTRLDVPPHDYVANPAIPEMIRAHCRWNYTSPRSTVDKAIERMLKNA